MNKIIGLLIILGIIISSLVLIYFLYDNPMLRHQLATSSGLKDKPILVDENFIIEDVIVGTQSSTALTFVEDGILFLEKESGQIRYIQNGILLDEPIWDFQVKMEGCECYTESGLLGITSINSDIYVYVTEELDENPSLVQNRIYKFEWINETFQNQQLMNILPGDGDMHHGGAMVADHNGDIFAVIGDQGVERDLQGIEYNLSTNTGMIFQVTTNDNVVLPENIKNYYGVGIRNSFGLAIDPLTNNLWSTENGTHEFDEINLIFPQYNSGWPNILGPASNEQKENLVKYLDYEYSDPEFTWEQTFAPTGISFVDKKWTNNYDKLFVGDCAGNLYKFQLNDSRDKLTFVTDSLQDLVLNIDDSNSEIIFGTNFGCVTDVQYNPDDGYLYVISYLNNGAIYKIKPR